ncbi:MAG: Adenosylcobinamide kinase / Adenosylcobinamide-phosphate guanylyltransferase, partial [uncultured Blastococcus sp.]
VRRAAPALPSSAPAGARARRRPIRQVLLRRGPARRPTHRRVRRVRAEPHRGRRRVGRPGGPAPCPPPGELDDHRDRRPGRRAGHPGAAGPRRLPDDLAGTRHGRVRGLGRAARLRREADRRGRRPRRGLVGHRPAGDRREQRGGVRHRAGHSVRPPVPRRAGRPQRTCRRRLRPGVAGDRGAPAAPAV